MRLRTSLGVVLCCLFLSSLTPEARAQGKGTVWRFDYVQMHRIYNLRNADQPKLQIPATPSGGEIIKTKPGQLETALETYWYTHKGKLTIDAPETVVDGQEVTLTATWEHKFDLKEDSGSSEASASVRIGLPEGDSQTIKGKLKPGSHTLKASKSVRVRFDGKDTNVLAVTTDKSGRYTKFGIDARSGLSNQATLNVYFYYKADTSGSTPMPPIPQPGRIDIAVAGNLTPNEVLTVTANVGGGHVGESLTLKLPAGLEFVNSQEAQRIVAGQTTITWRIRAIRHGSFEIRVHLGNHSQTYTVVIRETQVVIGKLPELPEHIRLEIQRLQEEGRRLNWSFQIGQTVISHIEIQLLCGFRIPEGIDFGPFVRHINERGDQWLIADRRMRDDFNRRKPNVLPELRIDARVEPQVFARKTRFDWRDYSKVSPVTHQGSCGSCWSFAGIGAFECSHLIRNDASIRGSEQQGLDCVKNEGCKKGGWYMDLFDYLIQHGGCPGPAYPYTAVKNPCRNVTSPYRAASWGFVAADGRKPTVDAMKAALCRHGPLCVTLRTTPAFQNYKNGVFNEHAPPRKTDVLHAVLIVGWDDSKGKGSWAVRNSWGAEWGDQGYIWVEYDCNDIGDHAAWVEAQSNQYVVPTLLMNDYRVKQGQDVYAPIHLLNATNVKNMDWNVHYDAGVANLVEPSVQDGNLPLLTFRANPRQLGRMLFGFAEHKPLTGTGQLARVHFKAVGAPGTKTPLRLELLTFVDPTEQPLPLKLVHGSIEVVKDEQQRLRGSCCGYDRLVLEDAICALEMSVELRPRDLIMDMNNDGKVNSTDAAKIIDIVMGAVRTGQ